ncbi:MAG: aminotransferase class I/II-fold pyridoxal phosphate-dependent enzyme [Chloroflexi bacterium]|jgi:8-amino-7-oxononanoate synthase|nr:aminotransferase class I/II-fold pyridoxal phosphate-dependent enzyme [Chloroflexota bacterium]HOE34301.1 aminotransferase class I/II-fold pyridoxal phosphate-dependent enzyme [Anaerolineaceae bacterium]HOT25859.1 aminotransferase class I/II-fold pyridoxal phosphate-dependent enzyme [Anaerolineaceae bacterium]HQH58008.1 aminotransferase class I/II-fold pyridoxal phosphate-dependent enzyme [Anaerolineaceae bacterium]HQK04056.1 aminotransferase class I/II-fold pyridoxal phosphate-dependent enz
MDIFTKCLDFKTVTEARARGTYPYFIPLDKNEGTEVLYEGRRIIMCGSNNYLGLTTHPKVRKAAMDAIAEYGTSCTGSRFLNGNMTLIETLERELAEWVGMEAALVFSTGMQVNLGTISALVGKNDIVILDKEDHASIVDGAFLSGGKIERFRHNDMEHLERVLKSLPEDKGKLLVVDGLFSMEGDIAPLPEIVALCERFGARLMVDDAHAFGVLGGGRGTAAHFGLTDKTDLIMSTFSKSMASIGGFIAGAFPVVDYIKHHARSLIFSASIPPANTATVLAALQIMREEPERVENVIRNGEFMREGFRQLGFDTGHSCTPVIPIIIGDDELTFRTWRLLFDNGVFVNPVISPATAPGRQLLRTSYMATHTRDQLEHVLDVFAKVGKEVGLI